jgi:hypothetical protein
MLYLSAIEYNGVNANQSPLYYGARKVSSSEAGVSTPR